MISTSFQFFGIVGHMSSPFRAPPFWASGLLVLSEPGAHFRKYSLAIPDLVRQRATSSYLQKNKKTAENQTLWQTNFLSHWFILIYLPKPRFLNVENIVLMVKTIPMDPHNVGEGAANPLIIIPQPHFLRRYGWIHRDIHIYIYTSTCYNNNTYIYIYSILYIDSTFPFMVMNTKSMKFNKQPHVWWWKNHPTSHATDLSRSGPRYLAPWQRQQGTEEVKQTKALRLDLGSISDGCHGRNLVI